MKEEGSVLVYCLISTRLIDFWKFTVDDLVLILKTVFNVDGFANKALSFFQYSTVNGMR